MYAKWIDPGRARRRARTFGFAVCLLSGLLFGRIASNAQQIDDCAAASNHLTLAVYNGNFCTVAQDCDTVRILQDRTAGCGMVFNKAARQAVESAVQTYARLCGRHWHCRFAGLQDVGCIRNRCERIPIAMPSRHMLELLKKRRTLETFPP